MIDNLVVVIDNWEENSVDSSLEHFAVVSPIVVDSSVVVLCNFVPIVEIPQTI